MLLTICCLFVENGSKKIDVTYAKSSSSSSDIQLMARAINGEARGEPYEGQVAVGAVILNRVNITLHINLVLLIGIHLFINCSFKFHIHHLLSR